MIEKNSLVARENDPFFTANNDVLKVLLVWVLLCCGTASAATTQKNAAGIIPKTAAELVDHSLEKNITNTATVQSVAQPADQPWLLMTIAERPLAEVFTEITQRSGIRFTLTSSLRDHSVTTRLKGTDWSAAVKSFLRATTILSIIGANRALRRVWVLGFGGGTVAQTRPSVANSSGGDAQRFSKRPDERLDTRLPLALWQVAPKRRLGKTAMPSEPIEMGPTIIDNLIVGQPLELETPQEVDPIFGVVGETHDRLAGAVQVWLRPLDGSPNSASFTISRGARTAWITVATGTNIYEVVYRQRNWIGKCRERNRHDSGQG